MKTVPEPNVNGFSAPVLLAVIVVLLVLAGGVFFAYQYFQFQKIRGGTEPPAADTVYDSTILIGTQYENWIQEQFEDYCREKGGYFNNCGPACVDELGNVCPGPAVCTPRCEFRKGGEPKVSPDKIDTSNWKTYRNEQYGFEVRYPEVWKPLENVPFHYKPPVLSTLFRIAFAPVTREEFEAEVELFISEEVDKFRFTSGKFLGNSSVLISRPSKGQNASISGLPATEVDVLWGDLRKGTVIKHIFVEKAGRIYLFVSSVGVGQGLPPVQGHERIKKLYALVDSFRFLEPTALDTSTWKTYRNEQYGFEVKYPKGFYLLDRFGKGENAVLISDKEIIFNEFLDGYYAPISIYPTDKAREQRYLDILTNKEVQEILVNGSKARLTKGVVPAEGSYYKYNTRVVNFEERGVTLIANDVYTFAGGNVSFDLDSVINQILSTFKFIE